MLVRRCSMTQLSRSVACVINRRLISTKHPNELWSTASVEVKWQVLPTNCTAVRWLLLQVSPIRQTSMAFEGKFAWNATKRGAKWSEGVREYKRLVTRKKSGKESERPVHRDVALSVSFTQNSIPVRACQLDTGLCTGMACKCSRASSHVVLPKWRYQADDEPANDWMNKRRCHQNYDRKGKEDTRGNILA